MVPLVHRNREPVVPTLLRPSVAAIASATQGSAESKARQRAPTRTTVQMWNAETSRHKRYSLSNHTGRALKNFGRKDCIDVSRMTRTRLPEFTSDE